MEETNDHFESKKLTLQGVNNAITRQKFEKILTEAGIPFRKAKKIKGKSFGIIDFEVQSTLLFLFFLIFLSNKRIQKNVKSGKLIFWKT